MPVSGLSTSMAASRGPPRCRRPWPSVRARSRRRTGATRHAALRQFSVLKLWPVEAFMTSTMVAGSSPNFAHQQGLGDRNERRAGDEIVQRLHGMAIAGAADLEQLACPFSRARASRLPTAAASPPIMIASEPSVARGTPPDTGASTSAMPRLARSAMGRARADRIGRAHVDHDRALRKIGASAPPSASSRQARTSWPVGSMVMMTSACLPSSARDAAAFAPMSWRLARASHRGHRR